MQLSAQDSSKYIAYYTALYLILDVFISEYYLLVVGAGLVPLLVILHYRFIFIVFNNWILLLIRYIELFYFFMKLVQEE